MKNFILLVSANSDRYGAERSLVSLAKYINRNSKYSSLVVIPTAGPIISLLKSAKVDFICQSFQGNVNQGRGVKLLRGFSKYLINFISARRLKRQLIRRKINVSLVHTNTITTDFGIQVALNLAVPHIWHVREMAKAAFNFDFELGPLYLKKMASLTDVIVCNSNEVRRYYQDILGRSDLITIYNGVSIPQVNQEAEFQSSYFKILMIARLTEEKEHLSALRACSYLLSQGRINFCFDLWGDGPDREKIERTINALGLTDRVNLKGYADSIPIADYSIGLSCCRYEAFGRATVEYMLAGLPVVGVNSGGNREIITAASGILYEADNITQFGQALIRLYDDNAEIRKLGDAAKAIAEEKFSESAYGNAVLGLYDNVI
jgi:glycosyltransferase involved in cell wall biosynthesis